MWKIILKYFFAVLFLCVGNNWYAQTSAPPSTGEAKDNFTNGNWHAALKEYLGLVKNDSSNALYCYRIGICYLETHLNKKKAIYFLDKAIKNGSTEKNAGFMLGKAYHRDMQFEKAIETYRKAIESSTDKELIDRARRYIDQVENAKQFTENPLKHIKIENLGVNINSEAPDYAPFIDEEENVLMFNSKRAKGNSGYVMPDGLFTIDIFMSQEKGGEWNKVRNIGGAVGNTADDEIVGMAADGSVLFTNLLTFEIQNDILIGKQKGKTYDKPTPMMPPVNQFESKEFTAGISPDGQILYFASDRKGGFGGFDIYRARLLPDGNWGEPENMGTGINTEWDELFPHVNSDGKSFFFASEGHTSIGGFDIFKSDWNDEKSEWSAPENIGYPINTVYDDYRIALNKNQRQGYISSVRDDTYGDYDIYSVTFLEAEERNTAMVGNLVYLAPIDYADYDEFNLYRKDGVLKKVPIIYQPTDTSWQFVESKKTPIKPGMEVKYSFVFEKDGVEKSYPMNKAPLNDPAVILKDVKSSQIPVQNPKPAPKNRPMQTEVTVSDALLIVHDAKTGDLVGKYVPSKAGKYVVIAPPGSYKMKIEAEGFKPYEDIFHIIGKGSFAKETERKLFLIPAKELKPIHYKELDVK